MRNPLLLTLLLIACSCTPSRYISVETRNPAALTFPGDMRRILIINNALPQDALPLESTFEGMPASVPVAADSVCFEFCRALGEEIAVFEGFDDVRILEQCFRNDLFPATTGPLKRDEVDRLCDEHEVDIVISLDALLFKLNVHPPVVVDFLLPTDVIDIEATGLLRVYAPGRDNPMTTFLLSDTVMCDVAFEHDDPGIWDLLLAPAQNNLLTQTAQYMANEARKHFIPYWSNDVRWFYVSYETRWKEATAYADAEKWDKALQIWQELYSKATSWKKRARALSNIALAQELTGHLESACEHAYQSFQLMKDHLGPDDPTVKKQEIYHNVLSNRLAEEKKIQIQINK